METIIRLDYLKYLEGWETHMEIWMLMVWIKVR